MSETDPLILKLYDALCNTFALGDNDIFQMEMPARLLDMGNYHYPGSDSPNSQQFKPPAVGEAEFRLADGMLDLSNLVGGPNGSRMAERHHQILFGLAPADVETSAELGKPVPDQQMIFDEEVPSFHPPASEPRDSGQTHRISRMDRYQQLLDAYEAERFSWDEYKRSVRPKDDDIQEKWDAYNRLLTTYAPAIDAELEEHHPARKYISSIGKETPGEAIQHAKEALRASVMGSIDNTEDVYPIVCTPSNWASYLSTKFRPEDLRADADKTRNSLRVAEKERAILSLRRDALIGGRQEIKGHEKAVEDARAALRTAQTSMVKGYGETAINCIQMYFETVTRKARNKIEAMKNLTDANKAELDAALVRASEPPLSEEQWTALQGLQTQCLQTQQDVMTATNALSNAQLAASQARGEDPTNSLEVINERIQSLTMDIEYYQKMLQAVDNPMGIPVTRMGEDGKPMTEKTAVPGPSALPTAPVAPDSQDGASIWQWFVIDSENSTSTSTKLSSTSVSHSDWSIGLWFASGSGHSDSATTGASKRATTANTKIQIGFHAMKFTIDRPWFKEQLLCQTKEFFHFSANNISAGDSKKVREMMKNGDPVDASQCTLPSWTTAFVVVKDVHIILTSESGFDDSEIRDMQSASASGGGFLCFQAAKSASSADHRDAFSMTSNEHTISIRIPAPQILGWVTQLA